jgi:hypothetical protein
VRSEWSSPKKGEQMGSYRGLVLRRFPRFSFADKDLR